MNRLIGNDYPNCVTSLLHMPIFFQVHPNDVCQENDKLLQDLDCNRSFFTADQSHSIKDTEQLTEDSGSNYDSTFTDPNDACNNSPAAKRRKLSTNTECEVRQMRYSWCVFLWLKKVLRLLTSTCFL